MKIVSVAEGVSKAALLASGVLRQGGIIVYPTDTLYGLGVDALADAAVDSLYALKGREEGKPIHAVCADLAMIEEYAELNDAARRLVERFLPGALTLVLRKRPGVTGGITRGMDTIGVRIPQNEFCLELARDFGRPYTATSANRSGMPPQASISAIVDQFGSSADHISLFIDGDTFPLGAPSTVVNVVSGTAVILREGAVERAAIMEALA